MSNMDNYAGYENVEERALEQAELGSQNNQEVVEVEKKEMVKKLVNKYNKEQLAELLVDNVDMEISGKKIDVKTGDNEAEDKDAKIEELQGQIDELNGKLGYAREKFKEIEGSRRYLSDLLKEVFNGAMKEPAVKDTKLTVFNDRYRAYEVPVETRNPKIVKLGFVNCTWDPAGLAELPGGFLIMKNTEKDEVFGRPLSIGKKKVMVRGEEKEYDRYAIELGFSRNQVQQRWDALLELGNVLAEKFANREFKDDELIGNGQSK